MKWFFLLVFDPFTFSVHIFSSRWRYFLTSNWWLKKVSGDIFSVDRGRSVIKFSWVSREITNNKINVFYKGKQSIKNCLFILGLYSIYLCGFKFTFYEMIFMVGSTWVFIFLISLFGKKMLMPYIGPHLKDYLCSKFQDWLIFNSI